MEHNLTMIGRVTYPKEQPVEELITRLPRKWTLKGRVSGSDLGQHTFQFRFELEEDLLQVLAGRPYHYGRWMVVLQRWEPILSPSFPSQIPFWISLHGLSLHYWQDEMIYRIAHDLGTLEHYIISKTSAKIRVSVDALQPLTKEALIEFSTGEELPVTLEYEGLENHCNICFRLTHPPRECPLADPPARDSTREVHTRSSYKSTSPRQRNPQRQSEHREGKAPMVEEPFHRRLDRHGRPFGERLPLPVSRSLPLRNKITPHDANSEQNTQEARRGEQRQAAPENSHNTTREHRHRVPNLQWRERNQRNRTTPTQNAEETERLEGTSLPTSPQMERERPLGRNLAETDYPPQLPPTVPQIPTTEEVMNELMEVTYQYTNVEDPIERAARIQRCLREEEHNLMATTAANIIATATASLTPIPENQTLQYEGDSSRRPEERDLTTDSAATPGRQRRARRPSQSPLLRSGVSSRRILLSQAQARPTPT